MLYHSESKIPTHCWFLPGSGSVSQVQSSLQRILGQKATKNPPEAQAGWLRRHKYSGRGSVPGPRSHDTLQASYVGSTHRVAQYHMAGALGQHVWAFFDSGGMFCAVKLAGFPDLPPSGKGPSGPVTAFSGPGTWYRIPGWDLSPVVPFASEQETRRGLS